MTESDDDTVRRVRWHLGRAEDCLDIEAGAVARARQLDPRWAQKFGDDADTLQAKLTALHDLMSGPDGAH